eukprot:COSAG01_NODE_48723_length_378_cov_1.910394_1_plen_92_part_01
MIRGAAAEALLTRPAGLSGLLGARGSVHTQILYNSVPIAGSWGHGLHGSAGGGRPTALSSGQTYMAILWPTYETSTLWVGERQHVTKPSCGH